MRKNITVLVILLICAFQPQLHAQETQAKQVEIKIEFIEPEVVESLTRSEAFTERATDLFVGLGREQTIAPLQRLMAISCLPAAFRNGSVVSNSRSLRYGLPAKEDLDLIFFLVVVRSGDPNVPQWAKDELSIADSYFSKVDKVLLWKEESSVTDAWLPVALVQPLQNVRRALTTKDTTVSDLAERGPADLSMEIDILDHITGGAFLQKLIGTQATRSQSGSYGITMLQAKGLDDLFTSKQGALQRPRSPFEYGLRNTHYGFYLAMVLTRTYQRHEWK